MRFFTKILKDWLDGAPPAAQGPRGPSGERDAFTPTWWQVLTGRGSDGRVYEIEAEDLERLRPVILLDDRAIARQKAVARRDERRRAAGGLLVISDGPDDDDVTDWRPPRAELLPAAKRGTSHDLYDGEDYIVFPPGHEGHDPSR